MWIITFILFTALFGLGGTMLTRRRSILENRLKRYFLQAPVQEEAGDKPMKEQKPLASRLISQLGERFAGRAFVSRWQKALEEAGVPLKPEEYFAVKLIVGGGILLLSAMLGMNVLLFLFLGLIGYKLPDIELKRRKEKRLQRCAAQLPDALGSMATSMRAGFSFMQALQMISREVPDPLGPEFAKTLREMSFGVSVEDALERLTERLPNPDLEMVVMALLIQRSTGGNLAELLDSVQETIRERVRIKEEMRALTAQGRASAVIVTLLPIVLGLFFQLMDPEYFSPMLKHLLGWVMIAYALVSGVIGWVVLKKMIRIEV